MTTVQAVYKDGVLHLLSKLKPEEIQVKFLQVELIQQEEPIEEKQLRIKELLDLLRESNPFKEIGDIVEWQRNERRDRELFNR